MVFAWVYQEMRYFIEQIICFYKGGNILRQIWCEIAADVNDDAHIVDLEIPQPVEADMYYDTCSAI